MNKLRWLGRGIGWTAAAMWLLGLGAAGCADEQPPGGAPSAARPGVSAPAAGSARSAAAGGYARLLRLDFNRLAAEANLPLFWTSDPNKDGAIGPDELEVIWGLSPAKRSDWVAKGAFTARFTEAYDQLVALKGASAPAPALAADEAKRRAAVKAELTQARPMAIVTKLAGASEQDRALVTHVVAAAEAIERIYLRQRGAFELAGQVPKDDAASQMLFYRNQGPWCMAPKTESDPDCHAIPSKPKRISGLYPASLQQEDKFCEKLGKDAQAEKLLHQFVVVREKEGKLAPVPYREEYAADSKLVSDELRAAADALKSEDEKALQDYLRAAAQAFLDDGWEKADEAWAKMNAENSKWYLRIGPDEVYFEPCSRKAGYHVSFARINQGSLVWQRKLDPVKNEMEEALAKLAGKPYEARKVSFHLPDFIDIVLNAGDSRDPYGATIGQSLPNWGPVANEGRGRTVAMTNLYTDPDSISVLEELASSALCSESMALFSTDPEPLVMSTVLHEAAHNLGPAHEYRVGGQKASEIFGGPLASMLEELKAQSSALYFATWLGGKGLITKEQVRKAHLRDVVWAFGHIARGMYDANKEPRPYSQLAGIQISTFLDEGAMQWHAQELAKNGKDKGCFVVHSDKLEAAAEKVLGEVAGILARGDKEAGLALRKRYVDEPGDKQALYDTIAERWLRAPVASFVYAVDLEP